MRRLIVALSALTLLPATMAFAGSPGEEATPQAAEAASKKDENKDPWWRDGTWTLVIENDRLSNTDRHYTNGIRLGYVSNAQGKNPGPVQTALRTIYPFALKAEGRWGFAVGQNMYAPEDLTRRDVVTNDRPYAGWLYVSPSLHIETTRSMLGREFGVLDTIAIEIGVVGPASLAEPTQKFVHRTIETTRPEGWDHQLSNEPGIAIIGERKLRTPPLRLGPIEADAIPHFGFALGNVYTHANAGGIVRIGQALNLDWGPPHIQPSLSGLEAVDKGDGFGWYVFAGVEGRAVGRNIFLDGNTLAGSHSVDKKTLVGDVQYGIAVVWRGIRIAMTQVMRTREFDAQRDGDVFNSLSLSARF